MKWKIVTDSSANIRFDGKVNENIDFQVVPFLINIGTDLYIDNDLNKVPELMDAMEASKLGSSSACASPDTFEKAFEGTENVICFTISSALSGSYNAAELGRNLLLESNPNQNVYIFDTLSAGSEQDLLIRKTIDLIEQGLDFNQVIEGIKEYHKSTSIVYMLESVDNLVKNGRLNKIVGGMIGLLGIRLVATRTDEGVIEIIHKSKGSKRALQTMLDHLIASGYQGGDIDVSYSLNQKTAEDFKMLILDKFPQAHVEVRPTSGLCSYYAQRGGLLVGYSKLIPSDN